MARMLEMTSNERQNEPPTVSLQKSAEPNVGTDMRLWNTLARRQATSFGSKFSRSSRLNTS